MMVFFDVNYKPRRDMLAPKVQIEKGVFQSRFTAIFQNNERTGDNNFIHPAYFKEMFLLLGTFDRLKGVHTKFRFTDEEKIGLINWFYHTHPEANHLPEAMLLKKLFGNLLLLNKHGNRELKSQIDIWKQHLATRWQIPDNNVLNLMQWVGKNITNVFSVEEEEFHHFLHNYLLTYKNNALIKSRPFVYFVPRHIDDNQKFGWAVLNMHRMHNIFSDDFMQGRTVLKARLNGTPYFLGMRYGVYVSESTFGVEVLLGEEQYNREDPLAGAFFRIALDTEGQESLRVVQMSGIPRKGSIIYHAWTEMGISPDKVLLTVALEFAKKHGFERIVGMRSSHLENASAIKLPYSKIFKQFGITQRHPLGFSKPISLLEERWEEKSQNKRIRNSLELVRTAFLNYRKFLILAKVAIV